MEARGGGWGGEYHSTADSRPKSDLVSVSIGRSASKFQLRRFVSACFVFYMISDSRFIGTLPDPGSGIPIPTGLLFAFVHLPFVSSANAAF